MLGCWIDGFTGKVGLSISCTSEAASIAQQESKSRHRDIRRTSIFVRHTVYKMNRHDIDSRTKSHAKRCLDQAPAPFLIPNLDIQRRAT